MRNSITRAIKAQFNKPTANSFWLKFLQSTAADLERMRRKKGKNMKKTQSILAANDIVLSEHRFHPGSRFKMASNWKKKRRRKTLAKIPLFAKKKGILGCRKRPSWPTFAVLPPWLLGSWRRKSMPAVSLLNFTHRGMNGWWSAQFINFKKCFSFLLWIVWNHLGICGKASSFFGFVEASCASTELVEN